MRTFIWSSHFLFVYLHQELKNMLDIKNNIVQVGDKVVTFYCDFSKNDLTCTRLRTGTVVKIDSHWDEFTARNLWAEIQIPIKIGEEEFHTYVHRQGNGILKIEENGH